VIVRYRDKGGAAVQSHGNDRLEWIWTTAAAILFIGLGLITAGLWAKVHIEPAPANAMRVEVLAKQFAWSFRYAGPDGRFGRTSIRMVNDANGNPFGLDDTDPAGRDDIVTSTLRVPVNVPVQLTLQSRDVIHNFFVRELRMKQDAVPGMRIPLPFLANRTGEFEIACSELCGLGHHQMRSKLTVITAEAFADWQKQMLEQLRQQQ